ncbi:type-2 fimbrial major subunit [Actinomyces sp. Chiba101]|uniref:LPXTG-motif cell wall anchor domain-containing protein/fimbrial isopeptide formation D2 domain-containing protein n=1 Tax=Actinomyces denticolens TaxID=52767 RepID=A0ABY1IKH8_9ACTO|nr:MULTISPECIES: SpaH/EbpB family LPXTG-anchored major pilin [Actinomyces]BAW93123.1 type-2 fimbrial major subunit [Actinomyces sp. Chiba101]GAV95646.1 type-2 fimbrial major subunit [Actinomyces denticolens]SHJ30810.1 LPXTG-motif cell wall anchor domain-containing protein/fimbrial isopeptide formation D2 domain-containing protein [Actinomyces denticolens]SUU04892.1 Fimbrial subunit type 1 precursor [Actinomyces denticolens]
MRATRFSRGTLGVAGVLCLGLSGLGATALAAPSGPGNIDFDATGKILIHKHVQSDTATPGTADGTVTGTKGAPVAGVKFTAYKLDADLKTNDAWTTLSNLAVPNNACGADFKTPAGTVGTLTVQAAQKSESGATNDQGEASIDNLAVGAYLVCETEAPANVTEKAAPFVVTVPFPNTTQNANNGAAANGNGQWIYDVNVYPKNVVIDAPTKAVNVVSYGLNGEAQVEFPVTATVPKIGANVSFKHFMISDPMDASYASPAVKANSVTIDGAAIDQSWYTTTVTGNEVNISFTKTGLEGLKNKAGSVISVTFTAKTQSVAAAINNKANLYVDTIPGNTPPENPPTTPPGGDTPVPSNTVVTAWGAASLLKQDNQSQQALEGATFEIYNAKSPWEGTCTTEIAENDPNTAIDESAKVVVDGKDVFTTDAQGKFDIKGLFVDSKQGAAGVTQVAVDHTTRCYVLVETKAPAGFTLPAGDAAKTALKVTAGDATTANQVTVNNTKTTVPQLPLTGAAGKILMTVGGLSLMAIAVGFVLAARKRRVNEA